MEETTNRGPGSRSPAEAGSPEFAEDRTQVNSLNNKWLFDETAGFQMTASKRGQENHDNLQARAIQSLDQLLNLRSKVDQDYFDSKTRLEAELASLRNQRYRHGDMWAYNQAYDLANPVSTAAGDSLRANAAPADRVTDSIQNATGGAVGVAGAAIAAAVAKEVDASVVPLMATLQQVVQTLATAATSIANVVNQVQPKTAA